MHFYKKIKYLIIFLVAMLMISGCSTSEKEDEIIGQGKFTQLYLECLNEVGTDYHFELGEEEYSITITLFDEEVGTIYSNGAYTEYLKNPKDLNSILDYYANEIIQNFASTESFVITQIVPVLKPESYLDSIEGIKDVIVYEEFLEGIVLIYVFDKPTMIEMVSPSALLELNIEKSELEMISLANLENFMEGFHIIEDTGVYFPYLEESVYTSSLLLIDDIWNYDNFPVNGDIIVAIPERDFVIVIGSDDVDLVRKTRTYCESVFQTSNYAVYYGLLKWNGHSFEIYTEDLK